jgi:hypothetical protein
MVDDEHGDLVDDRRHVSSLSGATPGGGGKAKAVGVPEKKVNTTYIVGEVVTGKEERGCKGTGFLASSYLRC